MNGLIYITVAFAAFYASYLVLRSRRTEAEFFAKLPKELKASDGKFNVNEFLLERIVSQFEPNIQNASSPYQTERGPTRILAQAGVGEHIEEFLYGHWNDFNPDYKQDPMAKNFFNKINLKFKVTERALLRTILYLRAEVSYFRFRDAVFAAKPKDFYSLVIEAVKFYRAHGVMDAFCIKRCAYELGVRIPLLRAEPRIQNFFRETAAGLPVEAPPPEYQLKAS